MAKAKSAGKKFKPMLSATYVEGETELRFPLLMSPKLDGFRAVVREGVVYSKNLKPIRNPHVQALFGRKEFNGLDGELIVGKPTGEGVFSRTSSGVTKKTGMPEVKLWVFEQLVDEEWPEEPFQSRFHRAESLLKGLLLGGNELAYHSVALVPHVLVKNQEQLLKLEAKWLKAGFEGIMGRDPEGPYKFGRATEKEGWLWKIKRFRDGEARVVRFEEAETNTNEAKKDELGRSKRSSAKAGKVKADTLGTIVAKDLKTGDEMRIGPGVLTAKERKKLWEERDVHENQLLVKYRVFDYGAKDTPRFPTCQGIVSPDDISQG